MQCCLLHSSRVVHSAGLERIDVAREGRWYRRLLTIPPTAGCRRMTVLLLFRGFCRCSACFIAGLTGGVQAAVLRCVCAKPTKQVLDLAWAGRAWIQTPQPRGVRCVCRIYPIAWATCCTFPACKRDDHRWYTGTVTAMMFNLQSRTGTAAQAVSPLCQQKALRAVGQRQVRLSQPSQRCTDQIP